MKTGTLKIAFMMTLCTISGSAVAQTQCTGNSVYWSASVQGMNNNGFPILYQGLNQPRTQGQAIQRAAACAGAQPGQVSLDYFFGGNRGGPVPIWCGQMFVPCD